VPSKPDSVTSLVVRVQTRCSALRSAAVNISNVSQTAIRTDRAPRRPSVWIGLVARIWLQNMTTVVRDVLTTLGLSAAFAGALFINDRLVERRVERDLLSRPDIATILGTATHSAQPVASGAHMQQILKLHWNELSQTRAYAVRFNGSTFTSRLVRISDVATPKTLNLVATDYRCGYCKADRGAVNAWLRENPNRDVVFIEAALLGPQSQELAKDALLRARYAGSEYYAIHNSEFDAIPKRLSNPDQKDSDLLAEQRRFLDALGIFATPTYVRAGVFHFGTLRASGN
jgi:hypothetical protein